jgi:hypothetical protein
MRRTSTASMLLGLALSLLGAPAPARADGSEGAPLSTPLGRAQAGRPAGTRGPELAVSGQILLGSSQTSATAMATLSIPLERVVQRTPASTTGLLAQAIGGPMPIGTPSLSRELVQAAWRAAGLGPTDSALTDLAARARWSALLPETRLRLLRTDDQSARLVTQDGEDPRTTSGTAQGSTWLEARLAWRLDRLLFADEETTVERLRLERQEARLRVATRALEHLAKWQRAQVEARVAPAGSLEAADALLRAVEAEGALDVLTGGWFADWRASPSRGP